MNNHLTKFQIPIVTFTATTISHNQSQSAEEAAMMGRNNWIVVELAWACGGRRLSSSDKHSITIKNHASFVFRHSTTHCLTWRTVKQRLPLNGHPPLSSLVLDAEHPISSLSAERICPIFLHIRPSTHLQPTSINYFYTCFTPFTILHIKPFQPTSQPTHHHVSLLRHGVLALPPLFARPHNTLC